MRPSVVALAVAQLVAAGAPLAQAQQRAPRTVQRASFDTSLLAALQWREIGPYRGGRSVAVAGSAARPFEYWMGTTGGGVFKTVDGGINWSAVADKHFGGTIGAIGVSESNPDIVYVGTGEFPIRGNVSHGDGVYKTTDGGKTWTHLGLTETRQISRVIVHPKHPDLVYVGAQGHVWGPNAERGVFRSRDGGKTWQKVLFRNDSTGITDLEIDPNDPNVLYAAFWQAHRRPWKLESGGAGSGLFKSTDGGDTWTEITRNTGLPRGLWGNLGVAVSAANSRRVWVIVEADSGGVFRSDDAGATWTRVNEERKLRQRPWYYMRIYADTKDTNTVYVSNVGFWRSTDGGKAWRQVRTPHADSHDLWVAPDDAKRMIEGNDGGANVTFNAGRSWSEQDYATAQFYHVITTSDFPYHVCGAQQDNSTICGPSRAPGGVALNDWYPVAGGESGYIAVRADDPSITYGGSYGGYLTRFDRRTEDERAINPWPENPMGHSAGETRYRFQWTYPIVVSPHDPNTLYAAANVMFMSTNEGESWTIISPDLTRADPATLGPSGGPITKDQTSVEYYGTIFAMAESPVARGVLWTGSDDGRVHVSRDAGKTWSNVTPRDLPEWARVSIIDASPHDAGTAYVAANRFQL
ncbi:MAG: VPS10 domain-containing protein, partial [Gemmatimonadaceae bacterium]